MKRMDTILRMEQAAFLPTRKIYRDALLRDIERDEGEDVKQAMKLIEMPEFEAALGRIAGKNR